MVSPQARPAGGGFGRTSHAPRARGRRCAARVISHTSSPQGSLFLVLFAVEGLRAAGELRQRRDRRFSRGLPREGKVMRPEPSPGRTTTTVASAGGLNHPNNPYSPPPASLNQPPAPTVAREVSFEKRNCTRACAAGSRSRATAAGSLGCRHEPGEPGRRANRGRSAEREFVRTSHAPRARGRRCAARVISYASSPQGSLFLVLFADASTSSRRELRQRLEPPFLAATTSMRRRRTGEATVPREGKVMRDALSLGRTTRPLAANGRAAGTRLSIGFTRFVSRQRPSATRSAPATWPTRSTGATRAIGPLPTLCPARASGREFVRTSHAPRARGRRCAARVISHCSWFSSPSEQLLAG